MSYQKERISKKLDEIASVLNEQGRYVEDFQKALKRGGLNIERAGQGTNTQLKRKYESGVGNATTWFIVTLDNARDSGDEVYLEITGNFN